MSDAQIKFLLLKQGLEPLEVVTCRLVKCTAQNQVNEQVEDVIPQFSLNVLSKYHVWHLTSPIGLCLVEKYALDEYSSVDNCC